MLGKGGHRVVRADLELRLAQVEGLPPALGGLLVASDLQGVELDPPRRNEPPALLGSLLAAELPRLAGRGQMPALGSLGVLLAGDLYAREDLDRRGGLGDATDPWRRFARGTRWVAGVAGNHDLLWSPQQAQDLSAQGLYPLDGAMVELDGLRIGGVGGVVGHPSRPNHRPLEEFLAAVERALAARPDILVLHQGPQPVSGGTRGLRDLRPLLDRHAGLLAIFGHDRWKAPLETTPGGAQLFDVHGTAWLLVP
jgi:hypothetical protein